MAVVDDTVGFAVVAAFEIVVVLVVVVVDIVGPAALALIVLNPVAVESRAKAIDEPDALKSDNISVIEIQNISLDLYGVLINPHPKNPI